MAATLTKISAARSEKSESISASRSISRRGRKDSLRHGRRERAGRQSHLHKADASWRRAGRRHQLRTAASGLSARIHRRSMVHRITIRELPETRRIRDGTNNRRQRRRGCKVGTIRRTIQNFAQAKRTASDDLKINSETSAGEAAYSPLPTGEVDARASGEGARIPPKALFLICLRPRPHLYLSEERSARFLSRRETFNASTPAMLIPALGQ